MGVPLAIAGMAVSAASTISQGISQKQAADYQAQVARNNAKIADQNVGYTMQAGNEQVAVQGMKTRAQVGKIKATQGASGIDVNTGSAAAVQSAASELGTLDAMTIRSNTARKAYGYEVEALNDRANAHALAQGGRAALAGSVLSAAGNVLSGGASVGQKYAAWQNVSGDGSGPQTDPWAEFRTDWSED